MVVQLRQSLNKQHMGDCDFVPLNDSDTSGDDDSEGAPDQTNLSREFFGQWYSCILPGWRLLGQDSLPSEGADVLRSCLQRIMFDINQRLIPDFAPEVDYVNHNVWRGSELDDSNGGK